MFVAETPLHPVGGRVFHEQMERVWVNADEIFSVLADLDISSIIGPDGIHPRLLKFCAVELMQALFFIFQRSLRCSVLPKLWLTSLVTPIFKNKSRYSPVNYCPVNLTSVCCKSPEKILVAQLTEYLKMNNLISSGQFGFQKDQLRISYLDIL